MNWPVTASSRHSSVAAMADWAAGWAVRPTAVASPMVIAPAAAAAGIGGSLTAAIQTPMLAAISTGPFGCSTASATPQPPISRLTAACAAQAGRGMSLGAGRHHYRDEQHAQRPQRLPLGITPLAGAISRLGHPGRSGLVLRGVVRQARRARPCLHGPSVALGERRRQIRHGCLPGYGPRWPPGRPAA